MRLETTWALGEAGHGSPLAERDRVLNPRGGQTAPAVVAFAVLAAVYLLTFGPFNSTLAAFHADWNALVLVASLALLMLLAAWADPAEPKGRLWIVGAPALALGAVIGVIGLLHGVALAREPGYQSINVAGFVAGAWRGENWKFAVFYLFFPVLLVLQMLLLRRVALGTVVRLIAIALILSVAVQWGQGLWDPAFLNRWHVGGGRVGGLATDPNAYAMSALLAAPLLLAGAVIEKSLTWRLALLVVAVLTMGGLGWAGNRTAVGGVALLVVSIPAVAAVACANLRPSLRLLLLVSPLLVVAVGLGLFDHYRDALAGSGLIGKRLVQSWDKVAGGGFAGLFFKSEERGGLLLIGWALLWKSPLAGWGPGGFYREYPNELFLETGQVRAAFDSVLNHYLMVPIDFGLPALLFYLVLMLVPLAVAVLALSRLRATGPRLVVVTLLATQFVFLLGINTIPPAYFPDVVWLWTLQLGLLLVVGERAGVSTANWLPRGRRRIVALGVAGGLVAVSAVAAYPVTFGSLGYSARLAAEGMPFRYERNCYGIEKDGNNLVRWCGRDARLKLPLPSQQHDEITVDLWAGNPDLKQNPLTIRHGGLAGLTQELTLSDRPSAQIRIPLDAAHVIETPKFDGKGVERFAVLSLDVSRTWVPKEWGVSQDRRELGVFVQLPGTGQRK